MNLILIDERELAGNSVQLEDRRAEHIVKVLRSDVGETVRVGIVNGAVGCGTVLKIKKKYPFSVQLALVFPDDVQVSTPPIDLILALPRPIMLRRILSQSAALGVGRIFLINARRVEKSFWEATSLEPESIRENLLAGLEQAVDTRLPEVTTHNRFKPFIEDVFPLMSKQYSIKVLGHPGGETRLDQVIDPGYKRVALAIGPEGGWIDYEVEKFCEQGFINCTVGRRILKVDTAVIAIHARISALLERDLM